MFWSNLSKFIERTGDDDILIAGGDMNSEIGVLKDDYYKTRV